MTRKQSFLVVTGLVCFVGLLVSHVWANRTNDSFDETESLELLIKTIDTTNDPGIQASLLQGMISGLEGRRNVAPPKTWWELSKKLGDSASHPERIKTIWGKGYLLVPDAWGEPA